MSRLLKSVYISAFTQAEIYTFTIIMWVCYCLETTLYEYRALVLSVVKMFTQYNTTVGLMLPVLQINP